MLELLPDKHLSVAALLPNQISFNRYLLNYMDKCTVENKSTGTMRVYRVWITDYLRYIYPETPTRQNAMSYLAALKNYRYTKGKNKDEPYSASTLHQAFRSLRTWFNWLASEDEQILPRSPLAGVKAPKLPQRIHRTFDAEQMARIILWCSQPGFHHSRNKAMIYIIYDTGMRVSELAAMQRTDVNIGTGAIRVIGKGDKERILRVSLETRKVLQAYLHKRTDDLTALWVSEERKPMTTEGIKTTFQDIARYAKIEGIKLGPHTYRHTAAKSYLMNGGDLRTLQYMLGHEKISTTEIYLSDIADTDMFKVHEKVSPVENMLHPPRKRVVRV